MEPEIWELEDARAEMKAKIGNINWITAGVVFLLIISAYFFEFHFVLIIVVLLFIFFGRGHLLGREKEKVALIFKRKVLIPAIQKKIPLSELQQSRNC